MDSSGVYVPRLAGLGPVMDEKSDSSATKKVSNVVMFKQGGICQLPASLFSTVDLSSEEGMMQLDKWHEELKKDEDAKNPLTENFKKDDEIVTLAELNDKISESLQHVGGDVSARALPAIALYFGFKKVGKAVAGLLNKANLALFVADLCATSEKLDWAGVYYGLCYSDFDKFEIWKFKYTNLEIKPLIQNPFFLVLPAESKQGWSPPVAWISGKVVYESPEEQFFGMFYSEVELKHVDGKLPTIKSETPLFYPGIPETTFSFVASACGNINPTYDIGIPSWGYSDSLHPKTTLTVKDKEEYAVNFYINEDCGTSPLKQYVVSYEDKDKDGFGNKYKIAVSCGEVEGYVENGVDCDDKDIGIFPEKCGQNGDNCNGGFIEGECSKVKLLAKRSSWMSCPAIDLMGMSIFVNFFPILIL